MSKLKFILPAAILVGMFSVTSCTKKTTNTTVVQDSIYYSAWTPLSMTQSIPAAGDTLYIQDITAPKITANIISKGAVVSYYGFVTQSGDTAVFDEAEYGYQAGVTFAVGLIEVTGYNVDLSYNAGGFLFRYVVIPGNVLTTSFNGMTQQQLNKMSFTDLQKVINASKQTSGNTFNP
ncbi:MAG TPA: hypothetical protein VGS79_07950 [Puia sp.]|nr:hypothetical protein [Puia sp.]